MDSINVNNEIKLFVKFLNDSWGNVSELFQEEDNSGNRNDWMQSNWEQLVEFPLERKIGKRVRLEIYGEGAEANGESSRVLYPNDQPNYSIKFKLKNKAKDILNEREIISDEYYEIDSFVTSKDNWYSIESPFSCVLFQYDEMESLVSIDEVDFFLMEI
jgi:hypothetical protein